MTELLEYSEDGLDEWNNDEPQQDSEEDLSQRPKHHRQGHDIPGTRIGAASYVPSC